MKSRYLLFILIPVAILASTLAYLIYHSLSIASAYDIPVLVSINETLGLNADTQSLNFGRLKPLLMGERTLSVSNNWEKPLHVQFRSKGDVKDWIGFSRNDFELGPHSNESVLITMTVPNAPFGRYNGTVHVEYKRKLW